MNELLDDTHSNYIEEFKHLELDAIRDELRNRQLEKTQITAIIREIAEYRMEEAYRKIEYKRGFESYIVGIILLAIGIVFIVLFYFRFIGFIFFLFYLGPFSLGLVLFQQGKKRMHSQGRSYKERFKYSIRDEDSA